MIQSKVTVKPMSNIETVELKKLKIYSKVFNPDSKQYFSFYIGIETINLIIKVTLALCTMIVCFSTIYFLLSLFLKEKNEPISFQNEYNISLSIIKRLFFIDIMNPFKLLGTSDCSFFKLPEAAQNKIVGISIFGTFILILTLFINFLMQRVNFFCHKMLTVRVRADLFKKMISFSIPDNVINDLAHISFEKILLFNRCLSILLLGVISLVINKFTNIKLVVLVTLCFTAAYFIITKIKNYFVAYFFHLKIGILFLNALLMCLFVCVIFLLFSPIVLEKEISFDSAFKYNLLLKVLSDLTIPFTDFNNKSVIQYIDYNQLQNNHMEQILKKYSKSPELSYVNNNLVRLVEVNEKNFNETVKDTIKSIQLNKDNLYMKYPYNAKKDLFKDYIKNMTVEQPSVIATPFLMYSIKASNKNLDSDVLKVNIITQVVQNKQCLLLFKILQIKQQFLSVISIGKKNLSHVFDEIKKDKVINPKIKTNILKFKEDLIKSIKSGQFNNWLKKVCEIYSMTISNNNAIGNNKDPNEFIRAMIKLEDHIITLKEEGKNLFRILLSNLFQLVMIDRLIEHKQIEKMESIYSIIKDAVSLSLKDNVSDLFFQKQVSIITNIENATVFEEKLKVINLLSAINVNSLEEEDKESFKAFKKTIFSFYQFQKSMKENIDIKFANDFNLVLGEIDQKYKAVVDPITQHSKINFDSLILNPKSLLCKHSENVCREYFLKVMETVTRTRRYEGLHSVQELFKTLSVGMNGMNQNEMLVTILHMFFNETKKVDKLFKFFLEQNKDIIEQFVFDEDKKNILLNIFQSIKNNPIFLLNDFHQELKNNIPLHYSFNFYHLPKEVKEFCDSQVKREMYYEQKNLHYTLKVFITIDHIKSKEKEELLIETAMEKLEEIQKIVNLEKSKDYSISLEIISLEGTVVVPWFAAFTYIKNEINFIKNLLNCITHLSPSKESINIINEPTEVKINEIIEVKILSKDLVNKDGNLITFPLLYDRKNPFKYTANFNNFFPHIHEASFNAKCLLHTRVEETYIFYCFLGILSLIGCTLVNNFSKLFFDSKTDKINNTYVEEINKWIVNQSEPNNKLQYLEYLPIQTSFISGKGALTFISDNKYQTKCNMNLHLQCKQDILCFLGKYKTTLLKILCTEELIRYDTISFGTLFGSLIAAHNASSNTPFLSNNTEFIGTISEIVKMIAKNPMAQKLFLSFLTKLDLKDLPISEKTFDTISGGQKKRVNICLLLIQIIKLLQSHEGFFTYSKGFPVYKISLKACLDDLFIGLNYKNRVLITQLLSDFYEIIEGAFNQGIDNKLNRYFSNTNNEVSTRMFVTTIENNVTLTCFATFDDSKEEEIKQWKEKDSKVKSYVIK